ncbi:MAG: hypothetical protein KKB51_20345 [Candidatus Riflebacteria bacterium]|nr:hypothetical protein [Candidatus Riflebacteria bacterium]
MLGFNVMMRIVSTIFLLLLLTTPAVAGEINTILQADVTVINDPVAATKLVGEHFLALQWISWDHFGKVTIAKNDTAAWKISGRQDSRENNDYLSIDGIVTEISTLSFGFSGKIVTKVSLINNGEPVTRSGNMTFRISGKRRYWRLKEMQNPEDNVVDYIDIFFK